MTGAPSRRHLRSEGGAWTPSFMAPIPSTRPRVSAGTDAELGERHRRSGAGALDSGPRDHAQPGAKLGADGTESDSRIEYHRAAYRVGRVARVGRSECYPASLFISLNTRRADRAMDFFLRRMRRSTSVRGEQGFPNTTTPDGQAAYNRRYGLMTQLDTDMISNEPLGDEPAELEVFREKANAMMYNPAISTISRSTSPPRIPTATTASATPASPRAICCGPTAAPGSSKSASEAGTITATLLSEYQSSVDGGSTPVSPRLFRI